MRSTRHANPELHWSHLKYMGVSPAHYLANIEEPKEQTAPMLFGSLVHTLTLGGEYTLYDEERRGNAWKDFKEAHAGELIVTRKEHQRAMRLATAVLTNPIASQVMRGTRELKWETELYGRKCAGRIDVAGEDLVDLKVSHTTHEKHFERIVRRMAYPSQLAWYRAARIAMGHAVRDCYIVGVEPKPPHAVTVFRMTPRLIEEGERLNRLWVERLKGCEESNEWPPYVQSIVDLDVIEDGVELEIDGETVAA